MAPNLDYWREYFKSANSDIFDIIEHGIMVAALDCPKEFKLRRDHVAELLFTCKITKCFGCDRIELSVSKNNSLGEVGDDDDKCISVGFDEAVGSKESKVNSSRNDHQVEMEVNVNQLSNNSFGDAEALTDEIEQESQLIAEVLRVKEVLDNHSEESDSVLFDSLKRLQLMDLYMEILQVTKIGKSVSALKKHGMKPIRDVASTLLEGWMVMVDKWYAAAAISENTSESVKTSTVHEEQGLPSPPLDEGFLFSTQTTMELSQFFEGMDEYGNPRNSGEFNKNREHGRKPSLGNQSIQKRKPHLPIDSLAPVKEKKVVPPLKEEAVMKKQSGLVKPNKPSNGSAGIARPTKPSTQHKVKNEPVFLQKSDKGALQKKPLVTRKNMSAKNGEQQSDTGTMRKKPFAPKQDKLSCSDKASIQVKMEMTKRKFRERYQEAENAKKQRRTEFAEFRGISKQSLERNPHMKVGNADRNIQENGRH